MFSSALASDLTGLAPSNAQATIFLVAATLFFAGLEVLSSYRTLEVFKKLDKAGLASRVRNLIRAIALLAWLTTLVSAPVVLGTFTVLILAHLAASIIQRNIDLIHQSRPAQPIANLKIKTRYDKVWQNLPQIKRRRSRIFYAADVWLTFGVLGAKAAGNLTVVEEAGGSSQTLMAGFLLLTALPVVAIAAKTTRRRRNYQEANVAKKIETKLVAELKKTKPEVVVYFSGARADRYQLEQWLKPINKIKPRTMIVVREVGNGKKFPKCNWPVVVAPTVAQLEKVTDISSLKAAVYVSNAAKNMHMLRNGKLKHVYLNHGDSDKKSSANPYSRTYDTLFVAGPAGKKRYTDIGFDGEKPAIVEVGRPQLDKLRVATKKNDLQTILYAPTWEGVADSVNYSSLTTLGLELAHAAAKAKTHKVVVKPHPNTGRFDKKMSATIQEISKVAAKSDWVEIKDGSSDLYKLFTKADLLISDVSAVVSDFLCTNKPLVMTRPDELTPAQYLKKFPIGRAATVVTATDGNAAFKAATTAMRTDKNAKSRNKIRAEVHGHHPKGAQASFDQALCRIVKGKPANPSTKQKKVKNKRVLITLNRLGTGGAERDCLELSAALSDAGYRVTVFAQHGELCDQLDKRVSYIERPAAPRLAARSLREIIDKFDLINTHDLRSLAILSRVDNPPPILAIVHNINSRRNDRLARWLLRNVPDDVIFVSESERKRIFGRKNPVGTVIRPSIGYATEFVKKCGNIKPDPNTILFCGRLSKERGPDLAIQALPDLPDKTLKVVGDGPMREQLAQLARDLGVASRVQLLGSVPDPYRHIAAAGLVIVPSRRDALPRIVRETAALGRPIVAADSPGVREAAADYSNIRFCNPNDPQKLLACINQTFSDTATRSTRQNEPSSWEPILKKFSDLENRANQQTTGEQNKITSRVVDKTAKGLRHGYDQQQQSNFDRMNQVVGNQGQQSTNTGNPFDGRQEQSENSHQSKTEPPQTSNTNVELKQDPPKSSADDGRLNHQVSRPVKLATKIASLIAPTRQLAIRTIGQQVNLGSHYSTNASKHAGTTDESHSGQSSHHHQAGNHMLVNNGISDPPREEARQPTSIQPAGPMLPTGRDGQRPSSELGETNQLVDLVDLHDLHISSNQQLNTRMQPSSAGLDLAPGNSAQPSTIRKTNDGVVATFIAAPLAEHLVRRHFEPRGITPNHVTLASTVCSIAGARLLTSRSPLTKVLGASSLGLGFVLDCADGQLARLTDTEQDSGMVLDEVSDRACEMVLLHQLTRKTRSGWMGDAAVTLLLSRHILSRLPQTKIVPISDAHPTNSPPADTSDSLTRTILTASQFTLGDRLAVTTAASILSPYSGLSTHLALGVMGLGRDLTARQIRQTRNPGSSEAIAALTLIGGLALGKKYPGKLSLFAIAPYIALALGRLPQDNPQRLKSPEALHMNRGNDDRNYSLCR